MSDLKTLVSVEQCLDLADFVVQVSPLPANKIIEKQTDIVVHTAGLNRIGLPDIVLLLGHLPNRASLPYETFATVTGLAVLGLYQAGRLMATHQQKEVIIGNPTSKLVLSKVPEIHDTDRSWFDHLRLEKLKLLNDLYAGDDFRILLYSADRWVS